MPLDYGVLIAPSPSPRVAIKSSGVFVAGEYLFDGFVPGKNRRQWHEGQKAKARCASMERLLAEAYELINMVELQHVRTTRTAVQLDC